MGKRTRTVDTDMERRTEKLRDTQTKYQNLLKLARQFASQFTSILTTQEQMCESFADLSNHSPELRDEFSQNGELNRVLVASGQTLKVALDFFVQNLETLTTKTIDDTIQTIRDYESSRVQYDAYRFDVEENEAVGESFKTEQARREFNQQRDEFHKLRDNLEIKLKFLEENKVKVMRKQLLILHNALAAYFSGNREQLEKTIQEFQVRVMSKGDGQSFLETH